MIGLKEKGNLVLTLRTDEKFIIGENITVTLLGQRKVLIECPKEIRILKVVRKDLNEMKFSK